MLKILKCKIPKISVHKQYIFRISSITGVYQSINELIWLLSQSWICYWNYWKSWEVIIAIIHCSRAICQTTSINKQQPFNLVLYTHYIDKETESKRDYIIYRQTHGRWSTPNANPTLKPTVGLLDGLSAMLCVLRLLISVCHHIMFIY